MRNDRTIASLARSIRLHGRVGPRRADRLAVQDAGGVVPGITVEKLRPVQVAPWAADLARGEGKHDGRREEKERAVHAGTCSATAAVAKSIDLPAALAARRR